MRRFIVWGLICCGLIGGGTACAPQFQGPTTPSHYVFSLRPSVSQIWLAPDYSTLRGPFATRAELIVRVHDARGQPVDGVPVVFAVASDWAPYASVTPQQTITRQGVARAIFRANTVGAVPVLAHVENMTQRAVIAVSSADGSADERLM
jgi:hypothetical protein